MEYAATVLVFCCQAQMTTESGGVDGHQRAARGVRFAADARRAGDATLVLRLHANYE